ncbi:MAG: YesL family protein [Lachnospiraceae bacterium]|nr:YesL family protein [Lachnospiraceae bacterium]
MASFNYDNRAFRGLSKLWDLIVVSLLFDLFAWPAYFMLQVFAGSFTSYEDLVIKALFVGVCMVPIGPALTAMYYTTMKSIRKDRGYVVKSFFHALKLNFVQGAIVGAILGVCMTIIVFNFRLVWNDRAADNSVDLFNITFIVTAAVTILLGLFAVMYFPVLSRFSNTTANLAKSSIFMAGRHIGWSFVMLLIVVVSIFAIFIILPLMFVLPAVATLIYSFPCEKVLGRYVTKPAPAKKPEGEEGENAEEGASDDNGVDAWYIDD